MLIELQPDRSCANNESEGFAADGAGLFGVYGIHARSKIRTVDLINQPSTATGFPVLTGAVIIVTVALIFNNLRPGISYPKYW